MFSMIVSGSISFSVSFFFVLPLIRREKLGVPVVPSKEKSSQAETPEDTVSQAIFHLKTISSFPLSAPLGLGRTLTNFTVPGKLRVHRRVPETADQLNQPLGV